MYHNHCKRCKSTLLKNVPVANLTDDEFHLMCKQEGYNPNTFFDGVKNDETEW